VEVEPYEEIVDRLDCGTLLCVGALGLSTTCVRQLLCWNDCFRKILGIKWCESVKLLQCYCSELPFEFIYDVQKWKYMSNLSAVFVRLVTLYQFKRYTLDCLSLKYAFNNCVSGMKCAVNNFLASVVLCDT